MPLSRKKSCARCRRSKLRCSLESPCSQCAKKRLACLYDEFGPHSGQPSSLSASTYQTPVGLFNASDLFDGASGLLQDPILDIGGDDPLAWDSATSIGYAELAAPKSFDTKSFGCQIDSSVKGGARLALTEVEQLPYVNTAMISDVVDPANNDSQLVSTSSPRTLQRRLFLRECVLTSVILGQLTGFPKLMLEGNSLPPFIQPPCRSDEELSMSCRIHGYHRCLPEILAICSSFVGMFYARTKANQAFIWKAIYTEGQRLCDNFDRFDHNERLAATQSITVFILLQASDLQSAQQNDSSSLVVMGMKCIMEMAARYKWRSDSPRARPLRREWVFMESIRRVATIFCIIDLLLEGMTTPDGHTCDSNGNAFGKNTLPCSRDIWEACNTRSWMMHYDSYLAEKKQDDHLIGRDLIDLDHSGSTASASARSQDVLRWCEDLDSLGTLTWMVLPLYRYRLQQNDSRDFQQSTTPAVARVYD